MLVVVVAVAALLRWTGVTAVVAAGVALAFGIGGVGVMALWSRHTGTMLHCTLWCPMGLLASVVGKLNPFRIRITHGCDQCGACIHTCRYGALNQDRLAARKPGLSCTLCGDCVSVCHSRAIDFTALGRHGNSARVTFMVMAITLHALFLGLARI